MAQFATPKTVDVLTSIWQEVLEKPDIGTNDDFFELGGNPHLAAQLCQGIERRLGRSVLPVMLYHSPTISSLAAALQDATFPKMPSALKLKSGTGLTPLFIAHGVGGTVLEFFELVKHIEPRRSVYGLQAKGSDGASEPLHRIEDMAEFHLETIRQLQAHGPYLLAGHSLGGLVVLEIARRLLDEGENPGVPVLIDSYPHLRHLPVKHQVRLTARLMRRRVFGAAESHKAAKYSKTAGSHTEVPAQVQSAWRRIRECQYQALERYRPHFYPGKMRFIQAAVATVFPDDPAAIWSHLAKDFHLDIVPGDHFEMLTTHAGALAIALSRFAGELNS